MCMDLCEQFRSCKILRMQPISASFTLPTILHRRLTRFTASSQAFFRSVALALLTLTRSRTPAGGATLNGPGGLSGEECADEARRSLAAASASALPLATFLDRGMAAGRGGGGRGGGGRKARGRVAATTTLLFLHPWEFGTSAGEMPRSFFLLLDSSLGQLCSARAAL